MFIGRKKELEFLNDRYESDNAEFIVLYGRRRVGKTELLKEFMKDKDGIFYLCNEYPDNIQLSSFSKALLQYNSPKFINNNFINWEDAINYIGELDSDKKIVIIIDEFPYMASSNKSIPSIIQGIWDHNLKNKNIMLILSGSSMSFFENEILGYKNPLYGRATGIYKLEPLNFYEAVEFFPNYTNEEKLLSYAILGGIPHYLRQFNPKLSFTKNVINNLLTKGTILFGEVNFLIHQELRQPAVYNAILEAIALGANKFGEICDKSQISSQKLTIYLNNLIELGIVSKEYSMLTSIKDKANKSKGEYIITDNLFMFYYRYIFPYLGEYELSRSEMLWTNLIKKDLHNFASKAFENICIEYLYRLSSEEKLPSVFLKFGRWWGKTTKKDKNGKLITTSEEVDILGEDVSKTKYILGECKFRNKEFSYDQFESLTNKINLHGEIYYYLFSLSGFSKTLVEMSEKDSNIKLITLDDIFK